MFFYIYDVSDRSQPVLKNTFIIEGYYFAARMLENGFIYLIAKSGMDTNKVAPWYDIGNGKVPLAWSQIYWYTQW